MLEPGSTVVIIPAKFSTALSLSLVILTKGGDLGDFLITVICFSSKGISSSIFISKL